MPVPVEERTKSGTKAFQLPQISLVMLPVAGLKSGKESLSLKCREQRKESRVRTHPYYPDQVVGVFCV